MKLGDFTCVTFIDSDARIPRDGGAQAYIAGQVAGSIFNNNNNAANTGGIDVKGGYTWLGYSIGSSDYSSIPHDLLYYVWEAAFGYGAQNGCNSISMRIEDTSGSLTFLFSVQPTDLVYRVATPYFA